MIELLHTLWVGLTNTANWWGPVALSGLLVKWMEGRTKKAALLTASKTDLAKRDKEQDHERRMRLLEVRIEDATRLSLRVQDKELEVLDSFGSWIGAEIAGVTIWINDLFDGMPARSDARTGDLVRNKVAEVDRWVSVLEHTIISDIDLRAAALAVTARVRSQYLYIFAALQQGHGQHVDSSTIWWTWYRQGDAERGQIVTAWRTALQRYRTAHYEAGRVAHATD